MAKIKTVKAKTTTPKSERGGKNKSARDKALQVLANLRGQKITDINDTQRWRLVGAALQLLGFIDDDGTIR